MGMIDMPVNWICPLAVAACSIAILTPIVLKLCHVIAWPWIWVLCSLWLLPVAVIVAFFIIVFFAWKTLQWEDKAKRERDFQ
jgi:hypothetical protein